MAPVVAFSQIMKDSNTLSKAKLATLLFLFYLCVLFDAIDARAQQPSQSPVGEQSLTLKWFGTSGWEIQIGQTVILIDPFLTRGEANPGKEWKTE